MAKPSSKRGKKPLSSSIQSPISSVSPSRLPLHPTSPPSQILLQPPSPTLLPFLSTLPQGPIYILHTDNLPATHKRAIFLVPLVLNTVLAALLLWRAFVALPIYISLLAATLGLDSRATINVHNTPWRVLLVLGARRAAMFFVDFVLARVVVGWPWEFVCGVRGFGTPLGWRVRVGFQEKELVVRQGRAGWWSGEKEGEGEVRVRLEREMQRRILPAVDEGLVSGKTGYALLNRDWELSYAGMIEGHRLLEKGEVTWEDFERKVAVWVEGEGWLVWEVARLEKEGRVGDGDGKGGSEDGRGRERRGDGHDFYNRSRDDGPCGGKAT